MRTRNQELARRKWLRIVECAREIDVDPEQVRLAIDAGELEAINVGRGGLRRDLRVDPASWDAWKDGRRVRRAG